MTRRRYAVPALVLGALVAQAGLASPARAATQRYAAPTGSGTACTNVAPCSLEQAVNAASSGDEVIVAPGTYTTGTPLSRNVANLNIHGAPGSPRPVINSSAARAIDIGQSGAGTRIADLTIVHTGGLYGLNVFAKSTLVQRVDVRSSGAVACSPGISGLMRDSLCVSTATNGIAIDDSWGTDTGRLYLRNVTAVATGAGSYGIRADANGNQTNLDIDGRNVIVSGVVADVRSTEVGSESESDVILASSNYDKIEEGGGGNVTNVGSASSNQTAPPVFVDHVTYRQAPGSPTIDKGASDSLVGSADLEGDARAIGTAPDIGMDEFDPTPPETAFTKTPKRKVRRKKVRFHFTASEAASFVCKVDRKATKPCASPLKVKTRRYGKHTVTVTATNSLGIVDPTPAVFEWKRKHKKKRR